MKPLRSLSFVVAGCTAVLLAGGLTAEGRLLRITAVRDYDVRGAGVGFPPLEGPLTRVALTLTDEGESPDFSDGLATKHAGLSGSVLPTAVSNHVFGILDSGAATHLVGYPDAQALGLRGGFVSGSELPIVGAGGGSTLLITEPIGFFMHGLQQRDGNGLLQAAQTIGQGNFAGAVNTEENHLDGSTIPTVIGAPLFAKYAIDIRNSEPVALAVDGQGLASPAVRFFSNPAAAGITQHVYRVLLDLLPAVGTDVTYVYFGEEFGYLSPSALGFGGALFFTENQLTLRDGTRTSQGKMMVDTAAQATIVSQAAAADLNLQPASPDFEVDIQGVGESFTAPGFFLDRISLPSLGGDVVWSNVPVVVLDVPSPEGNNMYGIFGANLYADRDLVFNGAAASPYLDLSEPRVTPRIEITALRQTGANAVEVDWLAQPAPQVLRLESSAALNGAATGWVPVVTGALPTITGTLSVTGLVSQQYFRLAAP